MKDFDLQKHLNNGAVLSAIEVRKNYGLTETELDLAIFKARKNGCPVVFKDGKLFKAKSKDDYELQLFKEMLERRGMKEGEIETRVIKANVAGMDKDVLIETRS